jgi:hypothetical protein
MAKFIKDPTGAFYEITGNGQKVVSDPRTIYDLFGGRLPYDQQGQDTSVPNVQAPSPMNVPNIPTATQEPQDPLTTFNNNILEMLKQAQGANSENLYKQQSALQRTAIKRTADITPTDLQVLSPSQQQAVRQGSTQALEPEIDAVAAQIKSRNDSIGRFESLLKTAGEFGKEFAASITPSKDILEGYKQMIRAGGQPTSIPDEIRNKVMSSLTPEDWASWGEQTRKGNQTQDNYKPPTSYQEWQLAGQPGTYADWLKNSSNKPPTAAQETVSTYASRMEQANPTLKSLSSKITGMNPVVFEAQMRLPSYVQSSEFQQYMQAARNFINAVLRRESGAVISPTEFDEAYKQYLPRPGDGSAVLKQKEQNRNIAYETFKKAAGAAYQPLGELLGGTASTGQSGVTASGLKYTIEP